MSPSILRRQTFIPVKPGYESTALTITGHRPQKIADPGWVKDAMAAFFISATPSVVLTGLALGVDTYAAELAVEMKIPFHAYVPFEGQELRWSQPQQEHYRRLRTLAAETFVIGTYPHSRFFLERNAAMVEAGAHVLAVWDSSPGGTAHCVKYALFRKRRVTRIDPLTREWTIEVKESEG